MLQLQGASYDEVSQLPWRAFPVQKSDDGQPTFEVSYKLGDADQTVFTTVSLTVAFLRRLKRYAEKALGREAAKCVLAVPAYFSERQTKALVAAAHSAGLKPVAFVSTVVAGSSLRLSLSHRTLGAVCYSNLHPPAEGTAAKKFLFVDVHLLVSPHAYDLA